MIERIKSNDLSDALVQMVFAGFLRQELSIIHGVELSIAEIHKVIVAYIEAVDEGEMLDMEGTINAR
jgi:hypothetical protein